MLKLVKQVAILNAGEENAINGKNYTIANECLTYAVTEYRPKTATSENPLPVIIVMPGFTRTKATMAQYAIELSKRNAIVYTIDPGSQGGTTYAGYETNEDGEEEMISATRSYKIWCSWSFSWRWKRSSTCTKFCWRYI